MPISEVVNDANWPQEFVDLIVERDRIDTQNIHVTSLSGCLRQAVLRNSEGYVVYTSKLYPLLRGILIHAGIEALIGPNIRAAGGDVELPLRASVDGVTIAGTLDYHQGGTIKDWKVPLRSKPPSEAYIQQINVYNWLMTEEGEKESDKLELVAFEPSKLSTYSIPKWPVQVTKQRVKDKLKRWTGELPPPDGIALGYCNYCPVKDICFGKPDIDGYLEAQMDGATK